MPTYEYSCEDCGNFEAVRPIAERDALCLCPYCGKESQRLVITAPNVSIVSGQVRGAHSINERSADTPKRLSKDGPGEVGIGVGRKSTTAPDGSKIFQSGRPWMLSR